jgi:hypothetical protein
MTKEDQGNFFHSLEDCDPDRNLWFGFEREKEIHCRSGERREANVVGNISVTVSR